MAARPPVDEVVRAVSAVGTLAHDQDGGTWWIPAVEDEDNPASWRPPIRVRGASFRRVLAALYPGQIPPVAKITRPFAEACEAAAFAGPAVQAAAWSTWDPALGVLTVAISASTLVAISASGVRPLRNGVHGVILDLPTGFQPIRWDQIVSGWSATGERMQAMRDAVTGDLPPPAAHAACTDDDHAVIIAAWWLGIFAQPIAKGRPLLALVGPPGCGKTVTARLLGLLYYGADFEVAGGVGGSRGVKDLVAGIAYRPVAVADDQNDVPRAMVDTLCRIATGSRVELATMRETLDLSVFEARASVAITANRPEWALRNDLLDRMTPLLLGAPPPSTLTEQDRNDRAVSYRAAVFAETFRALQAALSSGAAFRCRTRFQAWETLVRRAATAGGWGDALDAALSRRALQAVRMAVAADPFAEALYSVAVADSRAPRFYSAGDLYDRVMQQLGAIVLEGDRPSASAFRSPRALTRFLGEIERKGSSVVDLVAGPRHHGAVTWGVLPRA